MDTQRRYASNPSSLADLPRTPQPLNIPTVASSQLVPIDARIPPPALPPIGSQSLPAPPLFAFRTGPPPPIFDDSLNQSLYKVKQLESRLQMTEISNRALLEEVVRLQTELFNAIRQSQTVLQEERLSRQQIENNVRIQNDVILQLTARIKRNEDMFNDEHQLALSANASVRGLEQQLLSIQRDQVLRRDTHSVSVDGLRRQLDDSSAQRDQFEKIQLNVAEELRGVRNRLEVDSSNLNALTNELRQRTRKLDDDQRLMNDLIRKQQETINAGDLLFNSFRTASDQKMNEYRDLINELRTRLDFEREDRRSNETQLSSKLSELQSSINSNRATQTEIVKTMETMRREMMGQIEQTYSRLRQEMNDVNSQLSQRTSDKIDRLREDFDYKMKEYEKNQQIENEQRQRQLQTMHNDLEQQLDALKAGVNEEQGRIYNEIRETTRKSAESLRKLNDGITLIEQQTDENRRKIEKVLDAEIKSRKQQFKEISDLMTKTDEKNGYQLGSIQSAINNINTRIADLRDLANKPEIINLNRHLDSLEHSHREAEANIQMLSNQLADLGARSTTTDGRIREAEEKMKVDEQTVRDLAGRIALLPTAEDLASVRREINDKVRNDLQRGLKQQEEITAQTLLNHEQRVNNIRVDLNLLEEQMNQRITQSEQQISHQMRERQGDQDMWRREIDQKMVRLMNLRDSLPKELFTLNEKISSTRQECMKFSQESNLRTKDEIDRLRKDLNYAQRSMVAPSPKPKAVGFPEPQIQQMKDEIEEMKSLITTNEQRSLASLATLKTYLIGLIESERISLFCEVRALREINENLLARVDEISRHSQQKKSAPIATNRTVQQGSLPIKTSSLSPPRKPTTKTYARPRPPSISKSDSVPATARNDLDNDD